MKINLLSVFFICSILIIGCGKTAEQTPEPENATPKTLAEPTSGGVLNSDTKFSRAYYEDDIIEKLFAEALEKNEQLKKLHDKIIAMPNIQSDSLVAFNQYQSNNEQYWEVTNQYLEQIQDTVLRAATRKNFELLEMTYKGKINKHITAKERLAKQVAELNDRLVLMKLLITQQMMLNYQNNELPNIKSMEDLIKDYDKLIQETKQFGK